MELMYVNSVRKTHMPIGIINGYWDVKELQSSADGISHYLTFVNKFTALWL